MAGWSKVNSTGQKWQEKQSSYGHDYFEEYARINKLFDGLNKLNTSKIQKSDFTKVEKMVDLIENAQSDTFKAPCCWFENVPNTALTIVCTINVSIDCKKNNVSNLNQEKNILDCKSREQVAWFVFYFKIKLCAKMMISLLLRLMRT